MAQIFNPPEDFDVPEPFEAAFVDGSFDHELYKNAHEAYVSALRERALSYPGAGPTSGEVLRWPVADGHAMYMVFSEKPLRLVHMPVGDAWEADPILLRGLRLTDVREIVERNRRFNEFFARTKPAEARA